MTNEIKPVDIKTMPREAFRSGVGAIASMFLVMVAGHAAFTSHSPLASLATLIFFGMTIGMSGVAAVLYVEQGHRAKLEIEIEELKASRDIYYDDTCHLSADIACVKKYLSGLLAGDQVTYEKLQDATGSSRDEVLCYDAELDHLLSALTKKSVSDATDYLLDRLTAEAEARRADKRQISGLI